MKRARLLASVFLVFAAMGILLPSLKGDGENKRTKFTFPEAVRVGNTILQPGTYWFTIKEHARTHNIVVLIRDSK